MATADAAPHRALAMSLTTPLSHPLPCRPLAWVSVSGSAPHVHVEAMGRVAVVTAPVTVALLT